MDIAGVSTVLAQNNLLTNVGYALMEQQMEQQESDVAALTKMMELSVNPQVGSNIDVSV